jgi:UDP-N-acetylmuramoylalanine-D-glutamate ligase
MKGSLKSVEGAHPAATTVAAPAKARSASTYATQVDSTVGSFASLCHRTAG